MMKNQTLRIGAMLVALVTVCLTLGAGCATSSGGSYALKQTRNDIDWAMVRYNNRVAAGFVTPAQQDQVKAAHASYQTAYNEALQQAQSNLNAPTPDNVKQLANQLLSILSTIP